MDKNYSGLEIAIIGTSIRFPGASNIKHFWENLTGSVESISIFTEEELIEEGVQKKYLEKRNYVKARGIIDQKDIESFDASFFNFNNKEAELLEPQVRIMHECVWEALEDAGYIPDEYRNKIGLFIAHKQNLAWEAANFFTNQENEIEFFSSTRRNQCISTLISYKLNLRGPSLSIFTACSSSLVAIHLACQSLLNMESDIAVAGAITVSSMQKTGYLYHEGMINSIDGHCYPFDNRACGTVFANGAGVVVLKRLNEAIKDKDNIYAIIKGSAINNDGSSKIGYTGPSVNGQAEVIKDAFAFAEIESKDLCYIETHGTGTKIGDPIEFEGLKMAFNSKSRNFCALGAVKSNLGHLDTAAGMAGFIKTMLILKNKKIPPAINFSEPNQKIDFENSPFYINKQLVDLSQLSLCVAGVSSFGIGGTNAHIVLQESPKPTQISVSNESHIFNLSAQTKESLEGIRNKYLNLLKDNNGLNFDDICYTQKIGRKSFKMRQFVVASDLNEAIEKLNNPTFLKEFEVVEPSKTVFIFSDHITHFINIGKELYQSEPLFKNEIDECFSIYKKVCNQDLYNIVFPAKIEESDSIKNNSELAQIVLFCYEYSLARLLIQISGQPYSMIGSDLGEYVAACLAGVFTLEEAIRTITFKAELIKKAEKSVLINVKCNVEVIKSFLTNDVSIYQINSNDDCILSGTIQSIEKIINKLNKVGIKNTRLETKHYFNSFMVDSVKGEFKKHLDKITLKSPKFSYISTITGDWVHNEITQTDYWVEHSNRPINFQKNVQTLSYERNLLFLEIGSVSKLSSYISQICNEIKNSQFISFIPNTDISENSNICFLNGIGHLWLHGIEINWMKLYSKYDCKRVPLPTYCFKKEIYNEHFKAVKRLTSSETLQFSKLTEANKSWSDWTYVPIWKQVPIPYVNTKLGTNNGNYLFFLDDLKIGEGIINFIEKNKDAKIIKIIKGKKFIQGSDFEFTINPQNENDYKKLFSYLIKNDLVPDFIFHLFSFGKREGLNVNKESFEFEQDLGFDSLYFIIKSLVNIKKSLNLYVVTNNVFKVIGNEAIFPEKCTYLSLLRTIVKELQHVKYLNIEFDYNCFNSAISEKKVASEIPIYVVKEYLFNELNSEVSYRNSLRWKESYDHISLIRNIPDLPIRKRGTYLITGGIGGIGFELAKFLSINYHAKLVLITRNPLPDKIKWNEWINDHDSKNKTSIKIKRIKELEEIGSDFNIIYSDISNKEQLAEGLNKIDKSEICGVIHAAGVIDKGGIMQFRTITDIHEYMLPKTHGTINLLENFDINKLDFFVLCSSVSAVLSSFGEVAYSSSNLFLNSLAQYYQNTNKMISIGWSAWQKVGMAAEAAVEFGEKYAVNLNNATSPEEGLELFKSIISTNLPVVIISSNDLNKRLENKIYFDRRGHGEENAVSILQSEKETKIDDQGIESKLNNIFTDYFKLNEIGVNDNFYDLGANSLDMVQLVVILNKNFSKQIQLVDLYEKATINSLVYYYKNENETELSSDSLTKGKSRLKKLEKNKYN